MSLFTRIVKMSSPNLNVLTLLGSVLTYSSGFLFVAAEGASPPVLQVSYHIFSDALLCFWWRIKDSSSNRLGCGLSVWAAHLCLARF